MYDVITRRRRARLVVLLLLALALVADPLSHNHLIAASSCSLSTPDGSGSLQHPICPVCAAGGNVALVQQAATTVCVVASQLPFRARPLAELAGETSSPSCRAPPASLI